MSSSPKSPAISSSFNPPRESTSEAPPHASERPGKGSPAATSGIDPIGGAQQIADHMLGDQPASTKEEDSLGFGPYVAAVAKFLTDSSTKTPLTLSIEGLWGSGKSSFMGQLQQALRGLGKKKIVVFNAWQYNADDGLWAAFLYQLDHDLTKDLSWTQHMRARWRLFKLRTQWQGWLETLTAGFWLVASLVAFLAIAVFLRHGGVAIFQEMVKQTGEVDKAGNKTIALIGGFGGAVASLLLFLTQLKSLVKSPASLDKAARLFAKPNYDRRLPLIHQMTREFRSLVEAYAGSDDVYVFIDDLDRCEYTKAAELMQALLMLLNSAPKIALVIGLDRDKVAAAMATKQEKLIPYLYRVQPADAYRQGMEYGQRFLEKFIQASFVLPVPRPRGLKAMVNPDAKVETETVPENQKSATAINIVTGKDDSKTLDTMIEMADQVFRHNPRNVKQFANMFRLQAFIANETGLFGSWRKSTRSGRSLTIPQLGKYVLLCMRWPDFVVDATEDPDLVARLESSLDRALETTGTVEAPAPGGAASEAFWLEQHGLMNLLDFGPAGDEFSAGDFALADVDFKLLNEIAPARPKSTDASAEDQEEAAPARAEAAPSPRTEASRAAAPVRRTASQPPNVRSSSAVEPAEEYSGSPSKVRRSIKK